MNSLGKKGIPLARHSASDDRSWRNLHLSPFFFMLRCYNGTTKRTSVE
ncbi:MAG: hypothetical protein K5882_05615 [Bacteroidales bacterium]|nr:hypothetical protein [Bacteroidales bacterium]